MYASWFCRSEADRPLSTTTTTTTTTTTISISISHSGRDDKGRLYVDCVEKGRCGGLAAENRHFRNEIHKSIQRFTSFGTKSVAPSQRHISLFQHNPYEEGVCPIGLYASEAAP